MKGARVLWLEEDYMEFFEAAMKAHGYDVKRAFFLSQAAQLLKTEQYDLLLLDVMIPVEGSDIEAGFLPNGDESGLDFYRQYKDELKRQGVAVIVYTICGGVFDLQRRFAELGLETDNYLDKVATSNVNDLLRHMDGVLRYRRPHA